MTWSTRPPEPAGHAPTADEVDVILDQIEGLWVAWTPTLTNLTQGNGTVLARYVQSGSTVDFEFTFTLGSTSAVGTSPRFTLPVAQRTTNTQVPIATAILSDVGSTTRLGVVFYSSGSTVEVFGYSTTGTLVLVTATVPHTWAATDVMSCVGRYEAA
jgi:hypothetical protein